MPHIVEPCYHLTDCTWWCGPDGDEQIARTVFRPVAQYRGAFDPAAHKHIEKIVVYTTKKQEYVMQFPGRDPDLLVFSEQVFLNLVYDGVFRQQGRGTAEAVRAALARKKEL
jgi:hypothetical protein